MNSFLETAAHRMCNEEHYEIHYLKPYLSKDENDFTTISLKVEKLVTSPESFNVAAKINSDLEKSLLDMYGIDSTEVTKDALVAEKNSFLEKRLLETYREEGKKNVKLLDSLTKRNLLRKFLEKMGIKFSTYIENEKDLLNYITKASYVIYNNDKTGPADFAIISPELSTLVQGDFFTSPTSPELKRIYLVDEFARVANLKIFVDRISKGNSITVGRQTKENSTGVHLINFGESFHRETLPDSNRLVLKMKTSQKFIPGSTYISENVIIGKKPWLKKFLGL